MLTVLSFLSVAGLCSDLESTSTMQEGWGEEGCLRQSKVLPPPLAKAKVFPARSVRTVFKGLPLPVPLATAYLNKGAALCYWPSSTLVGPGAPHPGVLCQGSGRASVAEVACKGLAWAGQLAPRDLLNTEASRWRTSSDLTQPQNGTGPGTGTGLPHQRPSSSLWAWQCYRTWEHSGTWE